MGHEDDDCNNPLIGNFMLNDTQCEDGRFMRKLIYETNLMCLNEHKKTYKTVTKVREYNGKPFTRHGKTAIGWSHTAID